MKRLFCCVALALMAASAWADDLDALQGKWRVKKTSERGTFTQQIEFKKNQFTFKIFDAEDHPTFVAAGEVELKKQGTFNTARFFKIKAGRSETDLESTDEERNSVYLIDTGIFYLASNFDKLREREKPSVDAYAKAD
jgi:hypothetical protein